jgi:hypothetical protein
MPPVLGEYVVRIRSATHPLPGISPGMRVLSRRLERELLGSCHSAGQSTVQVTSRRTSISTMPLRRDMPSAPTFGPSRTEVLIDGTNSTDGVGWHHHPRHAI